MPFLCGWVSLHLLTTASQGLCQKDTQLLFWLPPPPPPFLLRWERKMLSNVIAPQHLKIKHTHAEDQKKENMSAFYLLRTIIWHLGCSLWPLLQTGTSSPISDCREWPHWPAKALDNWAHSAWHSSWRVMTDMLIKASLASPWQCVWRTLRSRGNVQLLWLCFHSAPSRAGHQANHWHENLEAGEIKRKGINCGGYQCHTWKINNSQLVSMVERETQRGRERETGRGKGGKKNWVKRFNVQLKIWHLPEVQMFHQSNGSPVG